MTENTPENAETPPDHLSIDPKSPFFNEAILERGIGIRFNGVEKTNVEEYNVMEGWVRVSLGKSVDRKGNPMTMKLKGVVEPYFRDTAG
ncbi:MAG: glutathione peroxidase [Acidocella sp. 20-61-6]|nr:MAG: glutathione peroxidase [Acidocella sp. 20-61-6]